MNTCDAIRTCDIFNTCDFMNLIDVINTRDVHGERESVVDELSAVSHAEDLVILDERIDEGVPVLAGVAHPVEAGPVDVGLEPFHVRRKLNFNS